jgi:molybdate transport system substrate-binding protein
MRPIVLAVSAALLSAATAVSDRADAADIKVLSAGAFAQVVVAMAPEFEKASGHKLIIENDTVGALVKRIDGGEAFDVTFLAPGAVDELIRKRKVADGSQLNLARVGVGVMVKEGAPKPDIGSVDAFRRAVLAAKSVAYINPASGGSSGIYVAKLFDQLGIADQVKPKAKLKNGGHVADLIASGEAELGIHQISEIVPVKGVTLIGPLPKEIQNYTTYAAGISASARESDGAKALVKLLAGPRTGELLKAKGMEPAGS